MTRHISGQIPTRPRDRRAGQRRHAAASAAHIRESARYRARGDWRGDTVARDDNGFILTGADAHAEHLLETSVPGIFAAGDELDDAVRVTIAVAALPRGAQIEIDCILDLGTSDTLKSRKGIARTNRKRHSNY